MLVKQKSDSYKSKKVFIFNYLCLFGVFHTYYVEGWDLWG